MVDLGLTIGAIVGVVLSGGFVYGEIGRYATPQVPETLFDERREVFAYTAGLFVGIPLALAFLFFLASMSNGALLGAGIFLAALVIGTELAQRTLLRTHYWGTGDAGPFYALGYRAGIGGIFALAIVAQYLAAPTLTWDGVVLVLLESAAVLALEVAGALLSLPPSAALGKKGGGVWQGGIFAAVGFFILGLGALSGTSTTSDEAVAYAAVLVALFGGLLVYYRLRPLLSLVRAPSSGTPPPSRSAPLAYGRTDRKTPADGDAEDADRRLA
jgi:hypothetical protein